jgi:hypothetical protein
MAEADYPATWEMLLQQCISGSSEGRDAGDGQ